MKVEAYSDKYFLDVVRIINNFHKESIGEYDCLFDPNAVIETIKTHERTNSGNAFLLIIDNVCEGILYGTQFKSMINDKITFQEIIWYVNKPFRSHGVTLLREVEKMLKSSGVSSMIMAVMENSKTEKIKRFYERLGYKPMEVHYVRNL